MYEGFYPLSTGSVPRATNLSRAQAQRLRRALGGLLRRRRVGRGSYDDVGVGAVLEHEDRAVAKLRVVRREGKLQCATISGDGHRADSAGCLQVARELR